MTIIRPTVGRIVWFWPASWDHPPMPDGTKAGMSYDQEQPFAAQIAHVWSDDRVNLSVIHPDGTSYAKQNVLLVQEGGEHPEGGDYCEWMPYQRGQAAKTEELEKAAPKPKAK